MLQRQQKEKRRQRASKEEEKGTRRLVGRLRSGA
jgi:hypothetical protein